MIQNKLFQPEVVSSSPALGLRSWLPHDWPVAAGWARLIAEFLSSAAGQSLAQAIKNRLEAGAVVYPPEPFKALEMTPLDHVRVVILGQDPYHGAGQAHGLAFSVPSGVKIPPSLRNIFKEIAQETGSLSIAQRADGCLQGWAKQGVLLLNTCLTVESGRPASHAKLGWEVLTDAIIHEVATRDRNVVFLLWGAQAQAKQNLLQDALALLGQHLVLCANHPSPLSALRPPVPFLGCKHFVITNQFLREKGAGEIKW